LNVTVTGEKTPDGGEDLLTAVSGALGATRTRGLYLRRVALYPLSYERGSSGMLRTGAEGEI
jgi:hypothetical protein